jgi:hypothetical protein
MRTLFLLLMTLWISAQSCNAAPPSDPFSADIANLEMRFFFHTFADETDDQRLDRLDKLVYGHVRQGSDQDRVTSLLLSVPNVQSTSPQQPAAEAPSAPSLLESEKPQLATAPLQPASSAEGLPAASTQPSADQSTTHSSSEPYPTVTAIEEQILGKTSTNLPVSQRIANLETKAFGKPSTSNDLADRVDALKRYVGKKNGGNENYLTSSNAVGWAPGNQSLEGEVASMEKEVYGVVYARDQLSARLTRLEKSLLPKEPPQTFTPLVTRINNLENVLNPNRAQQMISMERSGQTLVKKKHSIFHKLGVVAADVGETMARSAMSGGYGGYGYGGMPMMGSPMGYW